MRARLIFVTAFGFVGFACANGINVGAFHDPSDAGSGDAGGETTAVVSPAQLRMSPMSVDFGTVRVGETSPPRTFTVVNAGGATTAPLAVDVAQTEFNIVADDCAGRVLASADTCGVAVVLRPTAVGDVSGSLEVSDTPTDSASAALTGTGGATATFLLDPPRFDFKAVMGSGYPRTKFTVTNTGLAPSFPLVVAVTGLGFAVTSTTCSSALDPGGACDIMVDFAPACPDAGVTTYVGTLTVADGHQTGSAGLTGEPTMCKGN